MPCITLCNLYFFKTFRQRKQCLKYALQKLLQDWKELKEKSLVWSHIFSSVSTATKTQQTSPVVRSHLSATSAHRLLNVNFSFRLKEERTARQPSEHRVTLSIIKEHVSQRIISQVPTLSKKKCFRKDSRACEIKVLLQPSLLASRMHLIVRYN